MLMRNKASLSAEAGNIVRALTSGSLPNGLATIYVKELPRSPVRGAARRRAAAGHLSALCPRAVSTGELVANAQSHAGASEVLGAEG